MVGREKAEKMLLWVEREGGLFSAMTVLLCEYDMHRAKGGLDLI